MVEVKLTKILVENYGIKESDIAPAKAFIADFRMDSLDLVELVMFVEEEFGFEVRDEDAERLLTFGDAVRYIEKELAS